MLSTDDLDLCRRNPALAGLEKAFDPSYIHRALVSHGIDIDDPGSIQAYYIRHKPQTSTLIAYRLKHANQEYRLTIRVHLEAAPEKIEKPLKRAKGNHSPLGPAAIRLQDLCGIIMFFPHDHELSALSSIAASLSQRQEQAAAMAALSLPAGDTLTCLAYKPERRYVGKLEAENQPAHVIKLHDRRTYPTFMQSSMQASRSNFSFCQNAMSFCDRQRLVVYPWIDGQPLSEAMDDNPAILKDVAARLAEWHRAHRSATQVVDPATSLEQRIRSSAASLQEILPELADAGLRIASELIAAWHRLVRTLPATPALIHGDFSADQVIIGQDGPVLLDFDRARLDLPVHDLGSFIARLEYQAVLGDSTESMAREARQRLIGAYSSANPSQPIWGLEISVTAHLLCLVSEPFRRRQPHWAEQMRQLLARTRALLESARHGA
ncbi:MAG: aminoglycoside phosphotransferase family protein [Cyanobacteriota bacterium]|nr:aminoglycoside phosphotransferase family protein [Cyanobacteriota bacterium]